MSNHFYAYLYRLRYIERWSLMRNVLKENVAEHSFHVAVLAHALCSIANERFHKNVPTERIVTLALFHDVTEVLTGDIPTPIKHHNRNILNNFREIERLAANRMINMVPPELKAVYEPLLQPGHEEPELLIWIKAADTLDAYLKCLTEELAGNREFSVAKREIEHSLHAFQMPEVDYFLEQLAPSFEKTLDELTEATEAPQDRI